MKKLATTSENNIAETAKRVLFSAQLLLLGIAFPVLFLVGINTHNQQHESPAKKVESAATYTSPYDNATLIRI